MKYFPEMAGPRSAVGLVVGASGIKAVRVTRRGTGGRPDGSVTSEFPVDREPHPSETTAGLLAAAQALAGPKTRIAAGIGSRRAGLHFHELPFDQAEKVRRVIRFEAEPLFLDPVEDLAVDFLALPGSPGNGRPGLVFGARREEVADLIGTLKTAGLDPGVVLPERLGLIRAGMDLFENRPGPRYRLLVDLGASQTGLALFDGNRPLSARSVPYGGRDLTLALAETIQIPRIEAEEIKKATDLSSAEGADRTRGILAEAWDPIVLEIERTLSGSGLDFEEDGAEMVLAGGGASTPGLAGFLGGRLELPARPLLDVIGEDLDPGDVAPEALTSYGLALQALGPGRVPNLRQGGLAPTSLFSRHRAPLGFMAAGLALFLLLIFGDFYYTYHLQVQKNRTITAEINGILKRTAPHLPATRVPVDVLRQELDRARQAAGGVEIGRGRVLDLLLEVSRLTGANPALRITDLTISPQTMQLTGEGGDFETIDRLKAQLAALPDIETASIGRARLDPSTRVLGFKIALERRNP